LFFARAAFNPDIALEVAARILAKIVNSQSDLIVKVARCAKKAGLVKQPVGRRAQLHDGVGRSKSRRSAHTRGVREIDDREMADERHTPMHLEIAKVEPLHRCNQPINAPHLRGVHIPHHHVAIVMCHDLRQADERLQA
jgi:hypothetical protein